MKDPGYISEAAWNQEAPYRDLDWTDLEQDQRWDYVAGGDFFPRETLLPTRPITPGAVPGAADRGVTPPQVAGGPSAVGHHST